MRTLYAAFAIFLVISASTEIRGAKSVSVDAQSQNDSAVANYPNSPEGLKHLIDDLRDYSKHKQEAKLNSALSSLQFPDHSDWFTTSFGAEDAADLEKEYQNQAPQFDNHLRETLKHTADKGVVTVRVFDPESSAASDGLHNAIFSAMTQKTPIYSARIGDEKSSVFVGDFIFAQGGFRYIYQPVWMGLKRIPTVRVRMDGNVMKTMLKRKVQPQYPRTARQSHISGDVRLLVIIGTDGKVLSVTPQSGPQELVPGSVEAVRQWEYKPVLLNGKAMEVETTVDVTYSIEE